MSVLAAALAASSLTAQVPPADVATSTFRVFLTDGRALPVYGESAVVGDRVVFSVVLTTTDGPMATQLVSLPVASVDVDRTARYAKSVRAAYFAATTGEAEYQALTSDVATTLDALPAVPDPALRLQMAETARQRLGNWSSDHYDYHAREVREFVSQLDVAISQLSAIVGDARMAMDLAVGAVDVRPDPVLPPPSLRDSIEAALLVAQEADEIATREAVLRLVVDTVGTSPAAPDLVAQARTRLYDELGTDEAYRSLETELLTRADAARRRGDVPGVQALRDELGRRDQRLGSRRPEVVQVLADELSARLSVARAFRASLNQFTAERPGRLAYQRRVQPLVASLALLVPALERIRDGSPVGLDPTTHTLSRLTTLGSLLAAVKAPVGLSRVQAAFGSVIGLARQACVLHRAGLVAPKSTTADDASAAAAGAILLLAQARHDLAMSLLPPKAS